MSKVRLCRWLASSVIVGVIGACSADHNAAKIDEGDGWVKGHDGVFASLTAVRPAGEVIEIRGDRFRYRQHCDPEPNVPFVPEPVEGTVKFDGNVATLSGPGEWRILRRMVHTNGIDMLLRVDAYDALMRNNVMPFLGCAPRVEGASFENVDSKHQFLDDAKTRSGR